MRKFKPLKIAAVILIFSFLEATILADTIILNAKIELLLMLTIFLSLFSFGKFRRQVYLAAFFSGAAKDILSILPLGLNTLSFLLVAFLVEQISRHIFVPNRLFFSGSVFLGVFIQGFVCIFLSGEFEMTSSLGGIMKMLLPSSVLSTLLSPLAFSFFKLTLLTSNLSVDENT